MTDGNGPAPSSPTPQRELKMAFDERTMRSSYANMTRTSSTAEEVVLDFGVTLVNPTQGQEGQPDVIFQVGERVIMNYYTAKRLALAMGQLVRRHEEQFGALELDIEKRRKRS